MTFRINLLFFITILLSYEFSYSARVFNPSQRADSFVFSDNNIVQKKLCDEYVAIYDEAHNIIENGLILIRNILDKDTVEVINGGVRRENERVEDNVLKHFEEFATLPFLDPFIDRLVDSKISEKADIENFQDAVLWSLFSFKYSTSSPQKSFFDLISKSPHHSVIGNLNGLERIKVDGQEQKANRVYTDRKNNKFFWVFVEGFRSSDYFNSVQKRNVKIDSNGFSVVVPVRTDVKFGNLTRRLKYRESYLERLLNSRRYHANSKKLADSNPLIDDLLKGIPNISVPELFREITFHHNVKYRISFQRDRSDSSISTTVTKERIDKLVPLTPDVFRKGIIQRNKTARELEPTEYLSNWLENYIDSDLVNLYNSCLHLK